MSNADRITALQRLKQQRAEQQGGNGASPPPPSQQQRGSAPQQRHSVLPRNSAATSHLVTDQYMEEFHGIMDGMNALGVGAGMQPARPAAREQAPAASSSGLGGAQPRSFLRAGAGPAAAAAARSRLVAAPASQQPRYPPAVTAGMFFIQSYLVSNVSNIAAACYADDKQPTHVICVVA